MLEFFTAYQIAQHFMNHSKEGFENDGQQTDVPVSWIIIVLIISFLTAYIAYECNLGESPASRFLVTLFAFLFAGVYLIFYFIYHVLLDYPCGGGKVIRNIVKNITQKK
jgi:hypothetical protein